MKKTINNKRAFTLIEILVVTALVGVVVATATQIFSQILRSNQKARAILETKQTGDNALAIMTGKIRNAREVTSDCNGTAEDSIEILNPDETTTTFSCTLTDEITSETDGLTSSLTGEDLEASCGNLFTCYPNPEGGPEVVEISFTLTKAGSVFEGIDLSFSTTVSLRTY